MDSQHEADIKEALRDRVIQVDCQDCCDYSKALDYVCQRVQAEEKEEIGITVLGGMDGRMDHQMNNLSEMMKYQNLLDSLPGMAQIMMVGPVGTCTFISPFTQTLYTKTSWERVDGVGLIFLGDNAQTTLEIETRGLKWDLKLCKGDSFGMGSFQSSSNEFQEEAVSLRSNEYVLFSSSFEKGCNF